MARAARNSKTLFIALISACGGTTADVESGLMDDAGAELETSARGELADADAGDAAWYADGNPGPLDVTTDAAAPIDASASSDANSSHVSKHDASAPDSGSKSCSYTLKPDYALCLAATEITTDSPLTMQNTAQGAISDCAVSASGIGGRNLYYRFRAPAGIDTQVVVTFKRLDEPAVVRVLSDCYAGKAESSGRGLSDGIASACVDNSQDEAREVIIAVGRYSGDFTELTVNFDLTIAPLPEGQHCW